MKRPVLILIILVAVLTALVAAIIIISSSEKNGDVAETPNVIETVQTGTSTASDVQSASVADETEEASQQTTAAVKQHAFSDEEMDLMKELIFAKADGRDTESIMKELESISPDAAKAWDEILLYWDRTREEGFVNTDGRSISQIEGCPADPSHEGTLLPDGLAEDDSLCIVCLGFQLYSDGRMRDELIGRLEVVRACAMQYPNALILLTGGPTAFEDKAVTEADAMADWLAENGVDRQRIIVENSSLTSATNALFSYEILNREYPRVKEIAIVSSDYHVALGSQLFQAQFILARELGSDTGLNVVANAAYKVDMNEMFGSDIEANWLWILVQEQTASVHNIEGEM